MNSTPSPEANNPAGGQQDERLRKLPFWKRALSRPEFGALAGTILVLAFFLVVASGTGMFTPSGIVVFLEVAAQLGIIATAAALLMIGGEFDLSIGSMIGLAGVLIAIPVVQYGWPMWMAILLAFSCAGLVGWANGYLVNRTGLPSFIVTLAFLFILRGLAIGISRLLTGRTQIGGVQDHIPGDWLASLFSGEVGTGLFNWMASHGWIGTNFAGNPAVTGIPVSIVWWLGLTALATWILLFTPYGNWIFASGGDANAARNSGVPVRRVKVSLFMFTALSATVFACLQVMDTGSADTLRGMLKELEAIIAVVIGGALLTGGYGSAIGAALGALIFGMVQMGIFYTGVNTDWFKVFLGVMLLVAVLFNNFMRKKALEAK
ncbi:monosaccharide ABC transporter membrane protein (CUT2 family) [Chromohalobacter marismortui]|uniref:Xylose transport system permease protein XylH n=1 Tax=Chromohalobacter marismortui TaxID=42055 RepID=A0A4V3F4E2_9GAMM|nr:MULTISPECIES: ABC transporter permease [Chromohalobacter]MCI0510468.1 ABC transporter permease [Chromohalobacter sp.]MCI0594179.1 ABC transporter permease [Chromohalobacter sp.]TDU24956.1 monosaccharide ABC transporter membrane protein (CUT2 family) [Chromohalobacter marismortui]